MKRVRRGRRRRRPPPHRDHRPGMVELFFKKKKGKANAGVRVQRWEIGGKAPGPAFDDLRVSAERDQRHNAPDEAYGDRALSYVKSSVPG